MPQKNVIKTYVADGYYHLYNRGVEKRQIFTANEEDDGDYAVFLYYLKHLLSPKQPSEKEELPIPKAFAEKNFFGEIELIAYCLMPNHFHLLVKQKSQRSIEFFMRSLGTAYVMYFNNRYDRIGPLFQGTYKAVNIKTEEQLLHLSRYIHLNPVKDTPLEGSSLTGSILQGKSSYAEYLGTRTTPWVKPEVVLSYFKTQLSTQPGDMLSYQSFVESQKMDKVTDALLHSLVTE